MKSRIITLIITAILACSLSYNAKAQSDTMFIHMGDVILELPVQNIDSIIFYRTQIEDNTPFGTVSFKTSQIWKVGNQEWSDAVVGTKCKKDEFYGGTNAEGFKADCRQNGSHGDLFSWEAVNGHADLLCPEGWRVPTVEDFVALDLAIGGTGTARLDDLASLAMYLGGWSATLATACDAYGVMQPLSAGCNCPFVYYWSATAWGPAISQCLALTEAGLIYPGDVMNKGYGFTVRCVCTVE